MQSAHHDVQLQHECSPAWPVCHRVPKGVLHAHAPLPAGLETMQLSTDRQFSLTLCEGSPFHRMEGTPSSSSGLSRRLWCDDQAQASVMRALHHPFVIALASGVLPRCAAGRRRRSPHAALPLPANRQPRQQRGRLPRAHLVMPCHCSNMAAAASACPLGFGRARAGAARAPPLGRIGSSAQGLPFNFVASCNAPACREAFQSYIAEDAFFLKSFGELLAAGWQAAGRQWGDMRAAKWAAGMGAHTCIAVQGPFAPHAMVDVFPEAGAAGQAYEAQAGACMPADTPPSSHAAFHATMPPVLIRSCPSCQIGRQSLRGYFAAVQCSTFMLIAN